MLTEIVKIKPQLDSGELSKMESNLNLRFGKVALKFGKGLAKAMLGGGIVAAALTAINRLLNPLEAVEERIKSLLGQSENISDTAEKFGTTAGKFFKLEQLGAAAGLDQAGLKEMLTKFQEKIQLAQKELADPSHGISRSTAAVKNFVGESDVASAFFRAIQDLGTKDKETRAVIEKAIFGEKQTGAQRRFIDTDFASVQKKLGVENSDQLQEAFSKNSNINELSRTLEAARGVQQFMLQSSKLNANMITAMDEAQRLQMNKDALELENFQTLKEASVSIQKIQNLVDQGLLQVNKLIAFASKLEPLFMKISESRGLRIFGFGGN